MSEGYLRGLLHSHRAPPHRGGRPGGGTTEAYPPSASPLPPPRRCRELGGKRRPPSLLSPCPRMDCGRARSSLENRHWPPLCSAIPAASCRSPPPIFCPPRPPPLAGVIVGRWRVRTMRSERGLSSRFPAFSSCTSTCHRGGRPGGGTTEAYPPSASPLPPPRRCRELGGKRRPPSLLSPCPRMDCGRARSSLENRHWPPLCSAISAASCRSPPPIFCPPRPHPLAGVIVGRCRFRS